MPLGARLLRSPSAAALDLTILMVHRPATRLPIEGDLTGLARLEIADVVGFRDSARSLADAVASFCRASCRAEARDPRAPQNLLPIGALEARLRHRLGDTRLIRRRLADLISREVTRA
jgi:hypothetical protein